MEHDARSMLAAQQCSRYSLYIHVTERCLSSYKMNHDANNNTTNNNENNNK